MEWGSYLFGRVTVEDFVISYLFVSIGLTAVLLRSKEKGTAKEHVLIFLAIILWPITIVVWLASLLYFILKGE